MQRRIRWGMAIGGFLMALFGFGTCVLIVLSSSKTGEFPAFPNAFFMFANPLVYMGLVVMSVGLEGQPRQHPWVPGSLAGRVAFFITAAPMAYASLYSIVLVHREGSGLDQTMAWVVSIVCLGWFGLNATMATACLIGPSHLLDLSARVILRIWGGFEACTALIFKLVTLIFNLKSSASVYDVMVQSPVLFAVIVALTFVVAAVVFKLRMRRRVAAASSSAAH